MLDYVLHVHSQIPAGPSQAAWTTHRCRMVIFLAAVPLLEHSLTFVCCSSSSLIFLPRFAILDTIIVC